MTVTNWLPLESQITQLTNEWACRHDLVGKVTTDPNERYAASFFPDLAEVHLSIPLAFDEPPNPDPALFDLRDLSTQMIYPEVTGALIHEAGHAAFTKYPLNDLEKYPESVAQIVTWLEESRVEAHILQFRRIRYAREFLRSCALTLVLGDWGDQTERLSAQQLSQLILLSIARCDAGVLDREDVDGISDLCSSYFSPSVMDELRNIWCTAQGSESADASFYADLAQQWLDLIAPLGSPGVELSQQLLGEFSSLRDFLQVSVQDDLTSAAENVVSQVSLAQAKDDSDFRSASKAAGASVFARDVPPPTYNRRPPLPEERHAAVALGNTLEKLQYSDRARHAAPSALPPGRLRSRAAVEAAAQRSRGEAISALPFKRVFRTRTDTPPITLGVMVDISASMAEAMEPMGSTAWVLSEAATRIDAQVAQVYFGDSVFPGLKPNTRSSQVGIYQADSEYHHFDEAFLALNGALQLTHSDGVRVLVIVSDLHFDSHQLDSVREHLLRCQRAGVLVLVMPFEGWFDHQRLKSEGVDLGRLGVVVVPPSATRRNIVEAASIIGAHAIEQMRVVRQVT